MNLDLFDSVPEPEGAEDASPPVPFEDVEKEEEAGEPTPPEVQVWTVSEINHAVRTLLEGQIPPLWISGEVANWKRAGSGHCYFTLKDENAQLRCVMWRGDASRLPMDPEEGMKIRVHGQLTLYEARGDYQLTARKLEAEEGEGLWRLAFERLRKRLDEEGLLAPERKRPLPSFPQSVGVVTSLTGAALHDILTVLGRRAPWLRVLVVGARVQGEGAAEEIARGIRRLASSGQVEVLIVGRGGGSLEDLWAFNEEPVARAIAECPIPVVSAVGHEVDVTISDLVADLRAPTPSAAAEAVAPDKEEILRYLQGAGNRLARGLRRGVEGQGKALVQLRRSLFGAGRELTAGHRRTVSHRQETLTRLARGLFVESRRRLGTSREGLARNVLGLMRDRRSRLAKLAGVMDALSPLSTLLRGYAVPLAPEGRVLRRAADFQPGRSFVLRVVDGRVRCEVMDIEDAHVVGGTDDG